MILKFSVEQNMKSSHKKYDFYDNTYFQTLPPLLVTTIKLGTKSCGFAYQLKAEFEENPENVRSFIFKTGTTIRIDFPPALKLTGEGRAEEFGYEAIKQFEEMEGYSEDYVFFENVIESLYISEVGWV